MTQAELEQRARTGDVLLVKKEGIISSAIRVLTGESYGHVACLIRGVHTGGAVRIAEFVEGVGFQEMSLWRWLLDRQGQKVFYGVAPAVVHLAEADVWGTAAAYRDACFFTRSYGYLSLVKVWLSQLINRRIPVRQKVCSTFVQDLWRAGNYDLIPTTADPGDIAEHCRSLHRLV